MTQAFALRPPSADDIAALAQLSSETFVETFGTLYSEADLSAFLESSYSHAAIAAELDNPLRRYRVADQGGRLTGYCKIAFENTLDFEIAGRRAMELKQIYLRGDSQGSGIANAFMQWVDDEAAAFGADNILLSVFSGNARAQRFYARHGYTHIADTVFMVGEQADHEFIFSKTLK
jgi:GNAT superfamily N-acetyltransferase